MSNNTGGMNSSFFGSYLLLNERWLGGADEERGKHETDGKLDSDEIKNFFSQHIDITSDSKEISDEEFDFWWDQNTKTEDGSSHTITNFISQYCNIEEDEITPEILEAAKGIMKSSMSEFLNGLDENLNLKDKDYVTYDDNIAASKGFNSSLSLEDLKNTTLVEKTKDYEDIQNAKLNKDYSAEEKVVDNLKENCILNLMKDVKPTGVPPVATNPEAFEVVTYMNEIAVQEALIDENSKKIDELSTKETLLQSDYDLTEANLTTLQAILDDFETKTSPSAKGQEKLDAKKQELSQEISALKEKLEASKKELDDIALEKENYSSILLEAKTQNQKLTSQKDALIASSKHSFSEATIKALEDYDIAKTGLNNKKASDISKLDEASASVLEDISDIQDVIIQKQTQQYLEKYSTSALDEYDSATGEKIAQTGLNLYGSTYYGKGRCAEGVQNILRAALGLETIGDACDMPPSIEATGRFVEVTDELELTEENADEILKNQPAGAIIVWNRYDPGYTPSNGNYGHIVISDGNGNEISDFFGELNTAYWHRHQTRNQDINQRVKVYYPVAQ